MIPALLLSLYPALEPDRVVAESSFAHPAFSQIWSRTDAPVLEGDAVRSWFWGPAVTHQPLYERYLDSPDDERLIQYFDKGRMEINEPDADQASDWYVTSGLLTRELISGRIQIGANTFLHTGKGAQVPVAGDADNAFPTYADLHGVIDRSNSDLTGRFAITTLLPTGEGEYSDAVNDPNAEFVQYITYTGPAGDSVGYNIPRAFWSFFTESGVIQRDGDLVTVDPLFNWIFVLGYPISDPFWASVRVNGVEQWVLIQPFERRVLTYTPGNPEGWKVEMGNIGQHYHRWRYQFTPPTALSGDVGYFALENGNMWTYNTTRGLLERWEVIGTSRSFAAGSTLVERFERTGDEYRATYWSVTADGLHLFGRETLDANAQVVGTTMYWPPVHFFPSGPISVGQEWTTDTWVVSSTDAPYRLTVQILVSATERVATPAGVFQAWKLRIMTTSPDDAASPSALSSTVWFTPDVGVVQWLSDPNFAAQLVSHTNAESQ